MRSAVYYHNSQPTHRLLKTDQPITILRFAMWITIQDNPSFGICRRVDRTNNSNCISRHRLRVVLRHYKRLRLLTWRHVGDRDRSKARIRTYFNVPT